jgi:lysozyme
MDIASQLQRDEGDRYVAYPDQYGNLTTGRGHLIVLPNDAWMVHATLNQAQVESIFEADLAIVIRGLSPYAWYGTLDPVRRGVLQNMTFNMGLPKLLHFPQMISALARSDWSSAAAEMLNSLWASQLKYDASNPLASRPGRLANQILHGVWT